MFRIVCFIHSHVNVSVDKDLCFTMAMAWVRAEVNFTIAKIIESHFLVMFMQYQSEKDYSNYKDNKDLKMNKKHNIKYLNCFSFLESNV